VESTKLVKMANQIAANLAYGVNEDKAAESVRDHLRRFWSPPMREAIIEFQMRGGSGLSSIAALAVSKLAEQQAATHRS
jgi:formate dehydrogenase subunit delta